MKHISDIIKSGLSDLGRMTESVEEKTALLINAEISSRIRFEEIQIRKLCKDLEINPKKIKFIVEP